MEVWLISPFFFFLMENFLWCFQWCILIMILVHTQKLIKQFCNVSIFSLLRSVFQSYIDNAAHTNPIYLMWNKFSWLRNPSFHFFNFFFFNIITGSSASGSSKKDKDKSGKSGGSGSDTDASLASTRRVGPSAMGAPGAPPSTNLATVPQEVSGSRQSFRMAMGNPCEFFVDVMWIP